MPAIKVDFEDLGLDLTKFFIENISLPPEVEKALDTRSQMGILGNMNQYAAYQAASAIPDAARTPNSMAGAGMGLAAGLAMGHQMMNQFGQGGGAFGSQPPPPPPVAAAPSPVDRLKKLESLKAAGVLTDDEYAKKRAEIIAEI